MSRLIRLGRNFLNVACLRTFLTFHNFEFHWVTLLKALVTLILDGAVVNKNIGTVFAADETEPFCVIEPLYGSFQTCHLPSSVTCIQPHPGGSDQIITQAVIPRPRELICLVTCGVVLIGRLLFSVVRFSHFFAWLSS
jgi:hypothetical protein